MKYMGSKNRIAKHILPIMLDSAKENGITTWIEPFVGGGNMIDKVPSSFNRVGIDVNPHVIEALIAVRDLAEKLPDSLTEAEYKSIRNTPPSPVNSWLRFVASFGGKFDNGYAREVGSNEHTFINRAKRNAIKQQQALRGVRLVNCSYEDYPYPHNCIIYCDPPYFGATGYGKQNFNHEKFWEWCRMVGEKNIVFISEYNAPDDFTCVWQGPIKTNFASQRIGATHDAVEKLFKYNPNGKE